MVNINKLPEIIIVAILFGVWYSIVVNNHRVRRKNEWILLEKLIIHSVHWREQLNHVGYLGAAGGTAKELVKRIRLDEDYSSNLIRYFAGLSSNELIKLYKLLRKRKNKRLYYELENMLYYKSSEHYRKRFDERLDYIETIWKKEMLEKRELLGHNTNEESFWKEKKNIEKEIRRIEACHKEYKGE